YRNSGGFADYHALRHTYITALAKSNAPVKILQTLARHSTPTLTLGDYAHVSLYDQAPALEALPDLTRPTSQTDAQAATGTDGTTHKQSLAPHLLRAGDVRGRNLPHTDVLADSDVQTKMQSAPLKIRGSGDYSPDFLASDLSGSVSAAGARPGL